MAVPFFDIHYNLSPDEREAVLRRWREVLEHGRFIHGPEIPELEEKLAAFLGVGHVVGCSNGSDALVLALRAAGVGAGDEVIVPAFTFFATGGAVARLGAVPVFADVDPDTLLLTPEAAAAQAGPRTRAVVPVHLYGRPAPIGPLRAAVETAAGRGVAVVEDAAQAVGAASPEGPVGGLGDTAAWSCFPTKNLGALGDAGFTTTESAERAERMRSLRDHGGQGYHHHEVGANFRLDTLQAAVLLERLPHLLEWNAARVESAGRYRELFERHGLLGKVRLPEIVPGHVFHQYVIQTPGRDELRAALEERGVGTAIYYPLPLHLQPCFAHLGGKPGDLPVCERAAREVLALPVHPGITPEQQEEVVAGITAWVQTATQPAR